MNRDFLRGMGQSMNLFPQERGDLLFSALPDEEAFKKDLEQVGADMFSAIKAIDEIKNFHKQPDEDTEKSGSQHKPKESL